MRAERRGEGPLTHAERRLERQLPRFLVLVRQPTRRDLARLDVGLVEHVDAEHGARDGRRELPPEELGAEVVEIVHRDPDDRVSRALERLHHAVLMLVRRGREPEVHEEAVRAVDLGRAEGLAVDGDQPLPLLASRLGEELLEPRAEVVDRGRHDQRDLVASV